MRLSPLDIKKQEFSRKLRGIDDDEVHAFLDQVASQWGDMQDEQRRLQDRVRDLENKLEHYEKVEEALQEALQTARDSSEERLRNAEEKARVIKEEAESKARRVVQDARGQRQQFKQDIQALSTRRDELVARLRGFLSSELEILARFEGEDPRGYIENLATAEEVDPAGFDVDEEEAAMETPAPAAEKKPESEPAEERSAEEPPQPKPEQSDEGDDELAKIRRILNDLY